MKKIYFIRHGESEGNASPIQQDRSSSLSDKGRQQADSVAKRFSSLPIEAVVCSTMVRAKETAEIISKKISRDIEYSDLFVERRKPSVVYGKAKNDPILIQALQTIVKDFHLPNFRFSDEENFDDLKERAKKALEYLVGRPEENILVVTHGFFMRIILAYAMFGEALTGEECNAFIRSFHMQNTGITVLGYDEKNTNPWWLWIWNDHAHLD